MRVQIKSNLLWFRKKPKVDGYFERFPIFAFVMSQQPSPLLFYHIPALVIPEHQVIAFHHNAALLSSPEKKMLLLTHFITSQ